MQQAWFGNSHSYQSTKIQLFYDGDKLFSQKPRKSKNTVIKPYFTISHILFITPSPHCTQNICVLCGKRLYKILSQRTQRTQICHKYALPLLLHPLSARKNLRHQRHLRELFHTIHTYLRRESRPIHGITVPDVVG